MMFVSKEREKALGQAMFKMVGMCVCVCVRESMNACSCVWAGHVQDGGGYAV